MLLFMVIIKVIPLVSVFLALGSQVCVTPPAFFMDSVDLTQVPMFVWQALS